MKYILLMNATRQRWEEYARWPKEDLERNVAFMHAFSEELKNAGVLVATEGLGWPNEARLVHAAGNGEPVTDDVFSESKEFLAGYWIIDVEGPEEAYRIAARVSAAPGVGVVRGNLPIEVRQVLGGFSDLGM